MIDNLQRGRFYGEGKNIELEESVVILMKYFCDKYKKNRN